MDQYWVAWLTAILFGVLLVAEIFFLPETLYPRKLILSRLPTTTTEVGLGDDPEKTSAKVSLDIKRTKNLPFVNFTKIAGIEHPKPWDAFMQFCKLWSFPNIAVSVFFYCFAWFVSPGIYPKSDKVDKGPEGIGGCCQSLHTSQLHIHNTPPIFKGSSFSD